MTRQRPYPSGLSHARWRLMHHRRLAHDYEAHPHRFEAMSHVAMHVVAGEDPGDTGQARATPQNLGRSRRPEPVADQVLELHDDR
jgi:hypothetical protein